jgi:sporulation protein YlmC with PRC-barrel domain
VPNKIIIAAAVAALVAGAAYAQEVTVVPTTPTQTRVLATLPQNATTIANYYRQNVYDPSDAKIGEINDVLVGKDGKIDALIVGVGGFLGIGEKDVAVPFDAIHGTEKNGKWYLTMNATKDDLQKAHGYKFDKVKSTWVPA